MLAELGHKVIEDIEIGDKVWAYNEEAGEQELKEVVTLFRNESCMKTTLAIASDNGVIDEITSTPRHKYYLPDNKVNRNPNEVLEHESYNGLTNEWVSACDLKKGDRVLLSDGEYGIITSTKTESCEPFVTYNFEVADFHTYYVGVNGTLVHNMNCSTEVIEIETYANKTMKMEDAVNAWDDFLGPNQHNINPRTGLKDANRIFSADSTRSIRFSPHEMNSLGTTKAHFHFETWNYNANTNILTINNVVQRLRL